MKNTDTQISLKTVGLGAAVICLFLTAAAITPVFLTHKAFVASKKLNGQRAARVLALEQDAKNLKELIAKYKDERTRLDAVLFNDEDIATFLNNIVKFAEDANIKIKDMKAKEFRVVRPKEDPARKAPAKKPGQAALENQGPQLTYLPISIVIEGRFKHLTDFLLSLQKYRQLLTVSEVNIRRLIFPVLSCQFTLRLYSLRELDGRKQP